MSLLNRFQTYTAIHTQSDPTVTDRQPSAERERSLASLLVKELTDLGLIDVFCSEASYVYARLPASPGFENRKTVGFLAHLDTSPDCSGENVKMIVHPKYDGGDVELSGRTLRAADFPHLPSLKGRTLLTSDGTTLLGADDKAGIAEIMEMLEVVIRCHLPHGPIAVCFTPDEETGCGTDGIELDRFVCDFAYTVDGGTEGEIVYENFNAAAADFAIRGLSVHPGSAKDTMINAALVACEVNAMLPAPDTPRHTEGYEGFFHLCEISGDTESASLSYIVRDHDAGTFDARLSLLRHIEKTLNEKYGAGTVTLTIREQYRNMKEVILPHPEVVEYARKAILESGLEPITDPIRGGTDGARLSFMGIPCPNLGTGGYAYHGPCEHITLEGMEKAAEILVRLVQITSAEKTR